jgi:hypothetical protein
MHRAKRKILSHVWVTKGRVWIGDSIYCTLWYSVWLHFTVHCCTHTSPQSCLCSGCLISSSVVDVPLPLGSCTIPVLQLPASNSSSSQRLNCTSPLTAHQPTDFTPLYSLNWNQSVAWYSLRVDHIENTTPNSTFIVACGLLPSNGSILYNIESWLYRNGILWYGLVLCGSR